jgi:hypothetical protein
MSTPPDQPTEEEIRAYEEQLRRVRIEHVLLQSVADLINFGMRRTGRVEGTEAERDPEQVHVAIESVRALVPVLQEVLPEQVGPIRDALAQLQQEYVRLVGAGGAEPVAPPPSGPPTPPAAEEEPPAKPGEPGPAQRSGRLWVPGQ